MAALYRRGFSQETIQAAMRRLPIQQPEPEETADALAQRGFALRGGLHCAPYAHRTAGTLPNGTVRMSVSAFTSAANIDAFAHVLRSIVRG